MNLRQDWAVPIYKKECNYKASTSTLHCFMICLAFSDFFCNTNRFSLYPHTSNIYSVVPFLFFDGIIVQQLRFPHVLRSLHPHPIKPLTFLCFLMMRSYLSPLPPAPLWQFLTCALSSQCTSWCWLVAATYPEKLNDALCLRRNT